LFIVLAGVIGVVLKGRNLEMHSAIPLSEQAYPWIGVGIFVVLVVIEAFTVWIILRPNTYSRSWGRALTSLAIVSGAIAYWGAGIMHQPDCYFFHLKWLLLLGVALLVLFVVSAGASLKRRITNQTSPTR
jgi:hypothetical protein